MRRRRKKKSQKVSVPVASMGDIAFLLIIFFMVCGEFANDRSPPVSLPQDHNVDDIEQKGVIYVTVDREGTLLLQGDRVPDAKAIEYGVAGLIAGKTDPKGRIVMFKCDKQVDSRIYLEVLEAITAGGGTIAALGEMSAP